MQGQPELGFNVLKADGVEGRSRAPGAHPHHPGAVQQGFHAGQESHPHAAAEGVALHRAAGPPGRRDQEQGAARFIPFPGADIQPRRLPQQGPGRGCRNRVVFVPHRAEAASVDHGRRLEGQDVATLGAAALEHQAAILGLHAAEEAMGLGATTVVGLKGPLHDSTSGVPSRGGGRTFEPTSEGAQPQGDFRSPIPAEGC